MCLVPPELLPKGLAQRACFMVKRSAKREPSRTWSTSISMPAWVSPWTSSSVSELMSVRRSAEADAR
eukprot:CAMPEP_0175469172 /NCGR_PEP_ID=MMETSP0095-20121207/72200_1 /TAXON_ID=311494 /ORGANISM="Alexandrium monilatum, Strain CCMP3105" /LENGTH=66 /DNA_ID=CAMNT_0016770571 /DNA_START=371 /DNA_END=568 /DNA_ORIENTATION=-